MYSFKMYSSKDVKTWIDVVQCRGTLCYLTPSTNGDHTPECLLESCIYMEIANTIGQMLEEDTDKIIIEKNNK